MKFSNNQKKLLARLLERYEAKINKPRAERWVDAQYEAHFIGFEPQEFHDTMKLFKTKGFLSWELGNKRRADEGSQFDYNGRSYWVLISDSGITLARKCRDDIENGAKKVILPAWQLICAGIAIVATTVISNIVSDKINKTPNQQVEAIHSVEAQLKELNQNLKDIQKELTDVPKNKQSHGENIDLQSGK